MMKIDLPIDSQLAGELYLQSPVAQPQVFRRGNVVMINTRNLQQTDMLHQSASKHFVVDDIAEGGLVNMSSLHRSSAMHMKILGMRPNELTFISEK